MADSKNLTEALAYVAANIEFTPDNMRENISDIVAGLNHVLTYVSETGTGTCETNAVEINKRNGKITTEALTTAAGATQAITLANDRVTANSVAVVSLVRYTGAGIPIITSRCISGAIEINIINKHASDAFNSEFYLDFMIA